MLRDDILGFSRWLQVCFCAAEGLYSVSWQARTGGQNVAPLDMWQPVDPRERRLRRRTRQDRLKATVCFEREGAGLVASETRSCEAALGETGKVVLSSALELSFKHLH